MPERQSIKLSISKNIADILTANPIDAAQAEPLKQWAQPKGGTNYNTRFNRVNIEERRKRTKHKKDVKKMKKRQRG